MDPEAYFTAMDLPGFQLLIFAPRGTGDSSRPPTPNGYRIAGYVEDLESLRIHLGVDQLTLYGNSHGGMVSLAYACRHPDRVARLIVTNAPPRMDDAYRAAAADLRQRFAETFEDGAERLAAADAADAALDTDIDGGERQLQFRTLIARYVAHEGPAETAFLDRLCSAPMNWESVSVMYAEMVDGLDVLEGAEKVAAPALVIAGEFDVTVPPAAMRWIADALTNSRYVEFSGVGHFVEVEAGPLFSETVCNFLAG
jgi:pimeloyl-ACP methyl ester carboxylesterase